MTAITELIILNCGEIVWCNGSAMGYVRGSDLLKEKANSVSIISGSDGPTAVFKANSESKKSLKEIIKNYIYKSKCEKAKKKITPGAHTIEETAAYAADKYGAVEINSRDQQYEEKLKYLKQSLVLTNKPQLSGEDTLVPDLSNETETREFLEKLELRNEIISKIPDSEFPLDFHLYEINMGDSRIEIETDNIWNVLNVSCSGSRKDMKRLNKIVRDLYIYYGVSEEDIKEKSERYLSLLDILVLHF